MDKAALAKTQDNVRIMECILKGIDSNFYVSDIETNEILFMNENMKQTFGIKGNVMGLKYWEISQESWLLHCNHSSMKQITKDLKESIEWEEFNPYTERYYKNTDSIIEWINGEKVHMQTSVDIHDMKQEFFAAEQRLHFVIDHVPMSIFWKNADLVYQGGNLEFAKTIKDCQENIIGKTDYDFVNNEFAQQNIAYDKQLLETGETIDIEFQPPGTDTWMHSVKSLIRDKEGQTIGIVGIFEDITEKKKNENKLKLISEEAERANGAKGEFLSRMSHEIRTPMNAIIGMTNIARNSRDPEKKEYCLDKIYEASKHLLGILNDILDMSKIESSNYELSNEEFNLENMISDVLNIFQFQIDDKKQILHVIKDPELPAYIWGDELHLKQVITNLLSNAIKFTDREGSITFKIEKISGTESMSEIRFMVEDTGIGVTEEQGARIWSAFEQAEGNTTRKYGGTGLGLAISKRIVDLMGGHIWLESEVNVGTKFFFTIKVKNSVKSNTKTASLSSKIPTVNDFKIDAEQNLADYSGYLPFIDVETGLKRVLGKKKLYFTLLKNCKIRNTADELVTAIHKNDSGHSIECSHYIKSVATNLSLVALQKVAEEVEQNLKEGLPINKIIPAFTEMIDKTMQVIHDFLTAEDES